MKIRIYCLEPLEHNPILKLNVDRIIKCGNFSIPFFILKKFPYYCTPIFTG